MDNKMRWSLYTLPNGRDVYLTQRPDSADADSVVNFISSTRPLVRFSFCDDFIIPPTGVAWHWLPWVPGKDIPIENVFAFISMMDKYNQQVQKNPIWLHCDSSSMRAPTFFGLYLNAVYPSEMKEICKAMIVSLNFDLKYANYSRADKYADISLSRDPGVKELIKAWNDGGEGMAYRHYMGYDLDI